MEYISPINFPAYFGQPFPQTAEEIKRLKKKVLAEFELENADFIIIHKKEYDKNTCIVLIEQMANQENLAIHETIFSHKALLEFLESGKASEELVIRGDIRKDKKLWEFVAPYFTYRFGKFLDNSFDKKTFANVKQVLYCIYFLPDEHMDWCLQKIVSYLNSLSSSFTSAFSHSMSEAQINEVADQDFISRLDQLRATLKPLKTKLAEAYIDFIVKANAADKTIKTTRRALENLEIIGRLKTEGLIRLERSKEILKERLYHVYIKIGLYFLCMFVFLSVIIHSVVKSYLPQSHETAMATEGIVNRGTITLSNEDECRNVLRALAVYARAPDSVKTRYRNHLGGSEAEYKGNQLSTGKGVYEKLWLSEEMFKKGKDNLFFDNDTDHDMLIFFHAAEGGQLLFCKYLTAGDMLRIFAEPGGYSFSFYAGKDWNSALELSCMMAPEFNEYEGGKKVLRTIPLYDMKGAFENSALIGGPEHIYVTEGREKQFYPSYMITFTNHKGNIEIKTQGLDLK